LGLNTFARLIYKIKMDNVFLKTCKQEWFREWFLIIFGSLIMAAGYVYFITPYKIVPGGIIGIAIVIHFLTANMFSFAPEGLPIGVLSLILNIPLAIWGFKALGKIFGMKTIAGFVISSVFMDLLTYFYGYQPLVDDALLSSIFGGVLSGLGLGLIFKAKATSGGVDIVAMILAKRTRMPLGRLMIYLDSTIVLLGLLAFQDWKIPLYSWVVIYITGKVIDTTIEGLGYNKTMLIISERYEEIREKILFDLHRGGTLIKSEGMYAGQERKLIFTNVNRQEMAALISYIRSIDSNAFITIMEANEIIGDGFKSIKEFD
jgi:uncharacterized membrane-anchored protein YitT (DUF2179 family)